MSKETTARAQVSVLGRRLKALLLACALVCAASQPPAGRADAQRGSTVQGDNTTLAASTDGVIAYTAGGVIYTVEAGGGPPKIIVDRDNGGINRHPAVSPDGKRVAFSSSRDGNYAIYLVGIDGQGLQRLTVSYGDDSEPAWSPDGSKIAFVRGYDGTSEGHANTSTCASKIYVIDVPNPVAGGVEVGTEVSLTGGQGGTDPAWAPDGTRIAFSSYRDGNYEIYTMAPDGSDVIRLTNTAEAEAEPAWSPDGLSIAYAAHLVRGQEGCGWIGTPISPGSIDPTEETPGIYIMYLGRNRRWRVSGGNGVTDPTWSPDGSSIAYVSIYTGDRQLYTVDVASGLQTQLTFDPPPKSSPSWSSLGKSE
jgi:Tol biopolymer transport system component